MNYGNNKWNIKKIYLVNAFMNIIVSTEHIRLPSFAV